MDQIDLTEEVLKRYVELTRLIAEESGMILDHLTVGVVLGLFEGLASEGRTITIQRAASTTTATMTDAKGESFVISEPSLVEVMLAVFRRSAQSRIESPQR
jgi:hypothetical protein